MDNITLLKQQYEMVRGSRNVLMTFIDEHLPDQLRTPVASFFDKSLAYLLAHNANVYFHWLANFAMQEGHAYINDESSIEPNEIWDIYIEVDRIVEAFLNKYSGNFEQLITGTTASGKTGQRTALEIVTHVLTHEFHHKGQMLNMIRQLGHIPPDTDVIRF
jgi:uncharacterized damage-inducible protein DinB